MRVEKSQWDEEKYCWATVPTASAGNDIEFSRQPGFGVSLCWNKPSELWKPVLLIQFWSWHVSVGWLL